MSSENVITLTEAEASALIYAPNTGLHHETVRKIASWLEEKPFDAPYSGADMSIRMAEIEKANIAYVDANTLLIRAIRGMLAIVKDSSGVSGYHHDRVAAWSEFPEVCAARAAISAREDSL